MLYNLVDAGERALVLDTLATDFNWAIAQAVPLFVGESR
jgi:hypothetical protein